MANNAQPAKTKANPLQNQPTHDKTDPILPFIHITFFIPIIVIVITFYSPSCLGQETAKGPFGFRVKLPPVYHTRRRLHTVPLIAERQAGSCEYQFL